MQITSSITHVFLLFRDLNNANDSYLFNDKIHLKKALSLSLWHMHSILNEDLAYNI